MRTQSFFLDQILGVAAFLLFLSGCATTPKAVTTAETGKWDAKVMIKDKARDKSQVVLADIVAEQPKSVRIDFHTSLGNSLASFAINSRKMSYWVPSQKKFYSGPVSPEAFQGMLNTKIDPTWIVRALFEKDLEMDGWICQRDASNLLTECQRASAAEKYSEFLKFTGRDGSRRMIEYEHHNIVVKLSLSGQTLNEKYPENLFVVTRP